MDVKRYCDIHLVFLEGGVLGQLHRKSSIPKLISASTPLPKTQPESCKDTMVTTNHTYSSPTPHPIPVSETPGKPTSDYTYAENSDVPTEPYGSDSDSKLDVVSTGITSGGRLIVASTDKLEISVEYPNSAALLEETRMTQNASEMLLDASNVGIVHPNLAENTSSPLLDKPTDHEALLEATEGTEWPSLPLSDETNKILPDAPTDTEASPVATDINDPAKDLLHDETRTLFPETTDGVLPETMNQAEPTMSTQPDETIESTTDLNDGDSVLPEETGNQSDKTPNSDLPKEVTELTLESTTESPVNSETVSAETEQITETDGMTAETVEIGKEATCNSSPSQLSEQEAGTTTEMVIGEVSYSEHSNDLQQDTTLGDIPPDLASMQPIETSSVVSELPEFSQIPDTTITNSSSGSSPPQQSTTNDTSNKELSGSNSTGNSVTNLSKCDHLKLCIIRLTELSNKERNHWMSSSSQSMTTT